MSASAFAHTAMRVGVAPAPALGAARTSRGAWGASTSNRGGGGADSNAKVASRAPRPRRRRARLISHAIQRRSVDVVDDDDDDGDDDDRPSAFLADLSSITLGAWSSVVTKTQEAYRWASGDSFDDDDELYNHRYSASSSSSSSIAKTDAGQWGDETYADAASSWVTDDDEDYLTPVVETIAKTGAAAAVGVGVVVGPVGAFIADRRERAAAAAAAAAVPPPLDVVVVDNAMKATLMLGADEMHFLPIPDSGWSVALSRYRPRPSSVADGSSRRGTLRTTSVASAMDGAWDDSDFECLAGTDEDAPPPLPVVMVPGCASNAYTFDVAPGFSPARFLSQRGHDVWIVECRGVGFSRPWRKEKEWTDAKTGAPKQHTPTFGDFDFDTYLREDLPEAFAYVAGTTKSRALAGVGHSMGGMLLACLAAGGDAFGGEGEGEGDRRERSDGDGKSWELAKVVTIASCLECSTRSAKGPQTSVYGKLAFMAGMVPDALYGGGDKSGPNVPQLPLGPLSVGQAFALESVFGSPDDDDGPLDAERRRRWEKNAVSLTTSYPGATSPACVKRLLLKGFGNVPLRLVLQMATLFSPGGLATREETVRIREREVAEAKAKRARAKKWREKKARLRRRRERAEDDASGAFDVVAADEASKRKTPLRDEKGASAVETADAATDARTTKTPLNAEKTGPSKTGPSLAAKTAAAAPAQFYLDAVRRTRPNMLALAADCDPIFPPVQVAHTARAAGGEFIVFGDGPSKKAIETTTDAEEILDSMLADGGEHFSHYDLLCGVRAPELVYPVIADFLARDDAPTVADAIQRWKTAVAKIPLPEFGVGFGAFGGLVSVGDVFARKMSSGVETARRRYLVSLSDLSELEHLFKTDRPGGKKKEDSDADADADADAPISKP